MRNCLYGFGDYDAAVGFNPEELSGYRAIVMIH